MTATTPTDQPTPVEARASTTYALLPKGAKPSKSASTNEDRPVLCCAELRRTGKHWELVTSDSYQLARVPLDVVGDADGLTAGAISADALKALEKTGGFYANGRIEPCDSNGIRTGQSFDRPDPGGFPQWDEVTPEYDPEKAFTVGIDAELLYQLAQSLGR